MRIGIRPLALVCAMAAAQQAPKTPLVKSTAEEVILDIVVRDKKGKPVTDLKPEDITVSDSGAKQMLTSFRLVRGAEAIAPSGATTHLNPLQQIRLVTLAFEAMTAPDQRKLARSAALDLIKGEQGANVFYSVVVINTQLSVLQPFTANKEKLAQAIEHATEGLGGPKLASESDAILAELKRNVAGQINQDSDVIAAATQTAGQTVTNGGQALDAKLASVMLDMLRMDASVGAQDARLTLTALKSLVQGLRSMPGRKSILYFSYGMYLTPELDAQFQALTSLANRGNVTFYSVDTRGVMTAAQNTAATGQLNGAADASHTTILRTEGATTQAEIMSSDNAEVSARANTQLAIRDLAEATGGFLIGDSNDLRTPLREVNEEIASYYELSFNPDIQNYDGSFRKLSVSTSRKNLVIHARNGYFALPPEARAAGLQPFELPLLKAISEGKPSEDVAFHAGAVLLQPKPAGTDVALLVEVPLHTLQGKADAQHKALDVHCSLAALVKDSSGTVIHKFSRDRAFHVTADQLRLGNFVDKITVAIPPGKYTMETAVMDRESGKVGVERSAFEVRPGGKGVGISSLTVMHSYTPNVKGLDPGEPFQFQGGSVTPTLDNGISKSANAVLRLFFTVYQDSSISARPTVEIQFVQNGKVLANVPMQLPEADGQGRIPYLMTIPAASIPPGSYQVRATARQGNTASETSTTIEFLP
jgi:VWFA-related protein